jgi:hypothetical protein
MLPLTLHGKKFELRLIGTYRAIDDGLSISGAKQLTAEAFVECKPNEIREVKQTMQDVALLLSFATGTWISIVYTDIFHQDKLLMSELWSIKVYAYRDDPLLDQLSPEDLGQFIERGIGPLQSLRNKLKLGFALEYCVMAKSCPNAQIMFIVDFVGMEALLERLQNHIPHQKPRTLTSPDEAERRFLVLERLQSALQHYRLVDQYGVSNIAAVPNFEEIRNRLVHSGNFPTGVDPFLKSGLLEDVYQRLLLAILEYDGEYIDYMQKPVHKRPLRNCRIA